MIIKVSEIPDEGLIVEGTDALPAPFQDRSWILQALSLRLERDDLDVLVTGTIGARVPQVCGRCLEPFPIDVSAAVDTRFRPRPQRRGEDVELGSDDLEVDFYADDSLNLGTLVETETTLALPMKPLCREDCRGLCPVCGGNRNAVDCRCEVRVPDARLAVLKDLAARLQSRQEPSPMPLPKRRHSKTRGAKRRTHYTLQSPSRSVCPQCREFKLPHRVCPHCGYYKGREIVAVEGA